MTQETESPSGAAEERGEETPGLGVRLRSARTRQSLSIKQIAEELRLEPRLLQALEEERFKDLAAPVFARGYLRQYGKKLGLDCDGLLRDYDRLTRHTDLRPAPPQRAAAQATELRLSRRWIVAVLIAMFVAAAGAGAIWWFGGVGAFAQRFGLVANSTDPAALPYPTPAANATEAEAVLARPEARVTRPTERAIALPSLPSVLARPEARITRPAVAVEREPDGPSLAELILGNPSAQAGSDGDTDPAHSGD